MKMYNEIEMNEDYIVDIELSRIEKLIEQREAYEEEFFSLEPSTDEFDYVILQQYHGIVKYESNYIFDDFEENLVNPLV